jgi:glutamyl-tRNA reductase
VAADDGSSLEAVREFLANARGVDPRWLSSYLYDFEDREAIRHLFRVAASLDSMVLGEPQILGQLKAAYQTAREQGAIGGFLDAVLTRAFSVAKRVRTETEIGKSAVSVSFAAVELARQIFGNLKDNPILLLGAGKMSELAARHFRRNGAGTIFVTNRTRSRAEEMAGNFDGTVIDYEQFPARLHECDILIVSTGAPDFVLRKEDLRRALERRRNKPVFVIDIAVPRNVEPAANELEHVFLYDIDDLGRAVEANREARRKEAEEAQAIIDAEIDRLLERMRAREVSPTIVAIQQKLDELSRQEMERVRPKLGELSPEQEEALQAYTRGLLNKLAHGPMVELKRASAVPEGNHIVTLIRRMFKVDE